MEDDVLVRIEDGNWPLHVLATLKVLQRDGHFCDVTIALQDGTSLKAHSCVMYNISPYARNLLQTSKTLLLEGINRESWTKVLEYLYSGQLVLKAHEDLKGLKEAIKILDFKDMLDIVTCLEDQVKSENTIADCCDEKGAHEKTPKTQDQVTSNTTQDDISVSTGSGMLKQVDFATGDKPNSHDDQEEIIRKCPFCPKFEISATKLDEFLDHLATVHCDNDSTLKTTERAVYESSLLTMQLPKETNHGIIQSLKDIIFICPLCYFVHTNPKNYQKHLLSKHHLTEEKVKVCHLCKIDFQAVDELVSHYGNVHSVSFSELHHSDSNKRKDSSKKLENESAEDEECNGMDYSPGQETEQAEHSQSAGETNMDSMSESETPSESKVIESESSIIIVDVDNKPSISPLKDLERDNTLTEGTTHIEPVSLHGESEDETYHFSDKKTIEKAVFKRKPKTTKAKKSKVDYFTKYKKHCRIKCPFCSDFYFTNSLLDITFPQFLEHLYEKHCDSEHRLNEEENQQYKDSHMWANLWAKYQALEENGLERLGKVYVCPYCEKLFTQLSLYQHHVSAHTSGSFYVCYVCKIDFPQLEAFKQHYYTEHRDPVKCEHCEKVVSVRTYHNHLRRHLGNNVFPCTKCPKTYKHPSGLKYHMETVHLGEREGHRLYYHERYKRRQANNICSMCGKAFKQLCALKEHELRHRGEKMYTCERCETSFVTRRGLADHVKRVHTRENLHRCLFCPYENLRKYRVEQHMDKNHAHKKKDLFTCEWCSTCFGLKSRLSAHQQHCRKLGHTITQERGAEKDDHPVARRRKQRVKTEATHAESKHPTVELLVTSHSEMLDKDQHQQQILPFSQELLKNDVVHGSVEQLFDVGTDSMVNAIQDDQQQQQQQQQEEVEPMSLENFISAEDVMHQVTGIEGIKELVEKDGVYYVVCG